MKTWELDPVGAGCNSQQITGEFNMGCICLTQRKYMKGQQSLHPYQKHKTWLLVDHSCQACCPKTDTSTFSGKKKKKKEVPHIDYTSVQLNLHKAYFITFLCLQQKVRKEILITKVHAEKSFTDIEVFSSPFLYPLLIYFRFHRKSGGSLFYCLSFI